MRFDSAFLTFFALLRIATAAVPNAPAVSLHVDSNVQVSVALDAPLIDGGAAITHYTCEWDTDPGVQDKQDISFVQSLGTNAIQAVTISAPAEAEVQKIATRTTIVPEQQQIVITNAAGGFYVLTLDLTSNGGEKSSSGNIPFNADAATLKGYIDNMPNVALYGAVDVTLVIDAATNKYTYSITFPQEMGDIPTLSKVSSIIAAANTVSSIVNSVIYDGNIIKGSFKIQFNGEVTSSLAYDSTSTEVATALTKLSYIESVSVSREGPSAQNEYTWTVTFTGQQNAGNVLLMTTISDLTITTLKPGTTVSISVTATDGNEVGGTFKVSWNFPHGSFTSGTTNAIAFDA